MNTSDTLFFHPLLLSGISSIIIFEIHISAYSDYSKSVSAFKKQILKFIRPSTNTEAATGGVLLKKVFLEISQNSQENPCARDSFLIKLQAGLQLY